MDPDKPLSSDDLIREARKDLEAGEYEVLPTSEEMAEAADRSLLPTEVEDFTDSSDASEADNALVEVARDVEVEVEDELAGLIAPPVRRRPKPEPLPRKPSRGDHTPANVDGPIEVIAPTRSQTPTWRRFFWLIPVVVLGVGFLGPLFEETSTPVQDVAVGDCLDDPGFGAIESIDVKDCSEPHNFEVFSVFDIGDAFESYPGDDVIGDRAFTICVEVFERYVGIPYAASALWLTPLMPLEDSWQSGDREAACLVYESPDLGESAGQTIGSLRNSQR